MGYPHGYLILFSEQPSKKRYNLCMDIRTIQVKKILTPQKNGFLAKGQYPFTHSLSWAVGCGFGQTYCGKYCYAQMLPNWLYNRQEGEHWGDVVIIKENAPELLAAELAKAKKRSTMRIFMSSVTDPYQPAERKYRLTRRCLEVFAQYADLDLLVIQTRSPLVVDDLDLIATIPYAFLSMTLETDRGDLAYGPNPPIIQQRYAAVQAAAARGIRTQIAVAPCLPYSDQFAAWLAASGAHKILVDTFVTGDGSDGERTAESPFANLANYNWRNGDPACQLYNDLKARGIPVGWSAEGFASIPPRFIPA